MATANRTLATPDGRRPQPPAISLTLAGIATVFFWSRIKGGRA
ncbi:hypothetical protein O0544_01840 [Edwardsiella anguillarum]|nr:hypothetical protein [Edwardsiella anguillarum]